VEAFLLVLRAIPKSIQGYPLQLHSRRLKSPSAPFTTRTPQLCLHTPEHSCKGLPHRNMAPAHAVH
ncbi:hypothetical protein ILYODFUR_036122, partial [Ilyodon furcidens]